MSSKGDIHQLLPFLVYSTRPNERFLLSDLLNISMSEHINIFYKYFACVPCACLVHVESGTCRGQKNVLNRLELQLQITVNSYVVTGNQT